MSDASTTKPAGEPTVHDWSHFDAMSDEERHAAAMADPDAQPIEPEHLALMPRTPQCQMIRRVLGITQEEFASQFQIPLKLVQDWELGMSEPDPALRAYLRVITGAPDTVRRILAPRLDTAA